MHARLGVVDWRLRLCDARVDDADSDDADAATTMRRRVFRLVVSMRLMHWMLSAMRFVVFAVWMRLAQERIAWPERRCAAAWPVGVPPSRRVVAGGERVSQSDQIDTQLSSCCFAI